MVCNPCKKQRHHVCPGGNWCDCQCRVTPEQAADEPTQQLQEMERDNNA